MHRPSSLSVATKKLDLTFWRRVRATPYNNVVRASARFARSGVHGAQDVQDGDGVDGVERCMAEIRSCLAPRREPLNVS
jgi:hypothetical protein